MTDAQREAREKRVRDADGCDICGGIPCLVHEVARGIHRQKALLANYATLILCDECHRKVHQGMPVAEQLAYIMLWRDSEFDMPRYYKLTGRVWPSLADIETAHARLWQGINKRRGTDEMSHERKCRRCSECEGAEHHWIGCFESVETAEGEVIFDYACKHCELLGTGCDECDGEGCSECHGEGVVASCMYSSEE